jgi:hypothetical protein
MNNECGGTTGEVNLKALDALTSNDERSLTMLQYSTVGRKADGARARANSSLDIRVERAGKCDRPG